MLLLCAKLAQSLRRGKLENDSRIDDLKKQLYEIDPDYVVVRQSEYESAEHQTYKTLFEKCHAVNTSLEEENYNLHDANIELEKTLVDLKTKLEQQESLFESISPTTDALKDFLSNYINGEIVVSNVSAITSAGEEIVTSSDIRDLSSEKDISTCQQPGVYGFYRPSWFTPLRTELSEKNVKEKNARSTTLELSEFVSRVKKIISAKKNKSENSIQVAASEYDENRKKKIIKLLHDQCTNEEKYLKYYLLTPGLTKEYRTTIQGAAKLGIEANIVIELLELPRESFNYEVFEFYISELHKGNEYNLKKELAEELVRGDWYISANINGKTEKLQLVPYEQIRKMYEAFSNLSNITFSSDSELHANLAQSSLDTDTNKNEDFSQIKNSMDGVSTDFEAPLAGGIEIETDFDDSMIYAQEDFGE